MNKKTLLLAGAAMLVATSARALEVTPYAAARLSYDFVRANILDDDEKVKLNEDTWGGHLALGAKYKAFRLEAEYNQDRPVRKFVSEFDGERTKVNVKTQSLMINAYYDFNLCSRFTPYVSAGAGIAKLKLRMHPAAEINWMSDTSNFAWQVGAGVSYAATDSIDVDFGYRYVDTGAAHMQKEVWGADRWDWKLNTARHELYAGIRYNF